MIPGRMQFPEKTWTYIRPKPGLVKNVGLERQTNTEHAKKCFEFLCLEVWPIFSQKDRQPVTYVSFMNSFKNLQVELLFKHQQILHILHTIYYWLLLKITHDLSQFWRKNDLKLPVNMWFVFDQFAIIANYISHCLSITANIRWLYCNFM